MDCLARIKELLSERGWTMYQLAQMAEIPQSTLSNLFIRNNAPTIPTLEKICGAFDISMSDFFDVGNAKETEEQQLLAQWKRLPKSAKDAFFELICLYNKKTSP